MWDDNPKKILKNYKTSNLKKTLNNVDYIVLSPGISLIKKKILLNLKIKLLQI